MAWIESHQSLQTHRKTLRLSRQLGISRVQVIGHLHCLWWWCLDNAPDGDVTELDPMDIATAGLWDGDPGIFLAELIDSGFIDRDGDHLEIHDWWEFAGKLIDKRKANAERMRDARAKREEDASANGHNTYKERAEHVQRTSDARAGATVPNPTEQYRTVPNSSEKERGGGGLAEDEPAAAVLDAMGIGGQERGAPSAAKHIAAIAKRYPVEDLVVLAGDCRGHFEDDGWDNWSLGKKMHKFSKWVERAPILRNEDLAKHPARASPNGVPEPIHFYEPTADDLARIELAAKAETTRREQRRE